MFNVRYKSKDCIACIEGAHEYFDVGTGAHGNIGIVKTFTC